MTELMKKHNGMRPQDVVILLKIASKKDSAWMMKDLSSELGISAGEVSESLNRSAFSGLISRDKTKLLKLSLFDFLVHGLAFVFPQRPGPMAVGLATSHAAAPISEHILSNIAYVWPYEYGTIRGESIEPLHPKVPEACLKDPVFYEYMVLCEALRVGRVREKNIAIEELRKRLC